jgi:hypothetical protein
LAIESRSLEPRGQNAYDPWVMITEGRVRTAYLEKILQIIKGRIF